MNPSTAHRSHALGRRHDHEDPRQADAAFRRRLPQHPRRQPDRRQRARQLRLHRPLHRQRFRATILLGLPQQATRAVRPRHRAASARRRGTCSFRTTGAPTDKLTVNAGLRYEYFSPLSEADNRLVTLDAAPGLHRGGAGRWPAAPVRTPARCPTPSSRPFRAGFAPRVGIAWRPKPGTVVRTGYGINYNSSVYQYIAQQLAGQPPFAVDQHACSASPQTLAVRSKPRCRTCSPARRRTPTASIPTTGSGTSRSGISTCSAI